MRASDGQTGIWRQLWVRIGLIVGGVILIGTIFGRDTEPTTSTPPVSGVAVGSSEVAIATPRSSDERGCAEPADGYDAIGCYPGGELVQIAEVIDGDTLALVDGREIQLIGIDAPELDDCAGSAAADAARAKVGRQPAELHREAGLDRDKSGRLLAYIKFSDPFYYFDLAYLLTQDGWAKPFAGYAGNPAYMQSLKEAHDLAKTSHAGQFGPPCGDPYPTSGGSSSPGDGNVNLPNLPDGALTGGYCARKWWC